MTISKVLLICPIFLALACGEQKKFGGEVASKQLPAAVETPVSSPDETVKPAVPLPPVPSACSANKGNITKASSLSTGINLGQSNQTLRYELSVINCKDGSIVPIKDQALAFDLNLQTQNGYKAITYSVLDPVSGSRISAGDLETVQGSDLFGHTGEYGHWVTKGLSYSTNLDKVVLEINLKDIDLTTTDLSATSAESYLQVGDSTAVTQTLKILD